MAIDEAADGVFEFTSRAVHAPPDLLLSERGKSPVRTAALARLESNPTATGAAPDGNKQNLPETISGLPELGGHRLPAAGQTPIGVRVDFWR